MPCELSVWRTDMADPNVRRNPSPDNSSGKNLDPAEGARENVNIEQPARGSDRGGGITNRPIEDEQREQQNLPPRGENKEGGHA